MHKRSAVDAEWNRWLWECFTRAQITIIFCLSFIFIFLMRKKNEMMESVCPTVICFGSNASFGLSE